MAKAGQNPNLTQEQIAQRITELRGQGQTDSQINAALAQYGVPGSVSDYVSGTGNGNMPVSQERNVTPNSPEQDNAQLSVWMQIAGKDPNDMAARQQFAEDAHTNAISDPTRHQQDALDEIYANPDGYGLENRVEGRINATGATNQTAIDKLGSLGGDTTAKNQSALGNMQNLVNQQGVADQRYVDQTQGLTNQLGGYRDTANDLDWSQLANYQSGLNNLTNQNNGYVSGLGSTYANMPQLQSTLQANALASQAAQSYADAGDVAAQRSAGQRLNGIAGGSNDVNFYGLPGMSDLQAAYKGSQDVHVGQEDPAAYAAMQDALSQFKERSDPRVTDAERFLYEQSRRAQEQDERSNRGAVMSNLRQRGLSGASSEIADAAIGGQRASNDRLLSDLGANANAVGRAEKDLQNYGGLSSTMSAQANNIAQSNASNRLQALGQYTGLGADVSTGNMNRRTTGAQAAYGAASDLRAQGFDETYKRGTAQDAMSQFNENNRVDVQKYNQNYSASERDAAAKRAQDYASTGLFASGLNATNLTSGNKAATDANDATYGRNKNVLSSQDLTNSRQNGAAGALTDRNIGLQTTQIGLNNDAFDRSSGIASLGINNTNNQSNQMNNFDLTKSGRMMADAAAQRAEDLAIAQAKNDAKDKRNTAIRKTLAPWT